MIHRHNIHQKLINTNMDLRSFSQKNTESPPKDSMSETDIRRAINHFSKMNNDQLTRELSRHLTAKRAQGREHEIVAVIERIKPFLNDEQKRRLSEIMEKP